MQYAICKAVSLAAAFSLAAFSCAAKNSAVSGGAGMNGAGKNTGLAVFHPEGKDNVMSISAELAAIAETERARGYKPGLGISESSLREQAGDFAGAVIAAYKDLCWAHSYSVNAAETNAAIKSGLEKIKALYSEGGGAPQTNNANKRSAVEAAEAALDFNEGRFEAAHKRLLALFPDDGDEIDSFSRWMILVASLEATSLETPLLEAQSHDAVKNPRGASRDASHYSAIRARYELLPAYWYFGARHIKSAATEFAERCINLAPEGPYSAGARAILAELAGLKRTDGPAMRSKNEIEDTIRRAVDGNDPRTLDSLLPLIALADNPYTLYAAGALRSLANRETFKNWFSGQEKLAAKRESRLADRLRYIVF